MQLSQASC